LSILALLVLAGTLTVCLRAFEPPTAVFGSVMANTGSSSPPLALPCIQGAPDGRGAGDGVVASPAAQEQGRLQSPPARVSDVVDDYHGTRIADPYRWLEDTTSTETAAWIKAENSVTFAYLQRLPQREAFRRRLTELWNYAKVDVPVRVAGRLYFTMNSGLQNQAVLYEQADLKGTPKVILDPNVFSKEGATAVMSHAVSPDARRLAYATSIGGSDFSELRVRDLASGQDLPDRVQWVKVSNTVWTEDGRGFFYSRYPAPPPGAALTAANANHKLYYHTVGTAQEADRLVLEVPEHPDWIFVPFMGSDGRYLFISVTRGTETRRRLYYLDLKNPKQPDLAAPVIRLIDQADANYVPVGVKNGVLFALTDLGAPNHRVIAIDLAKPDRAGWTTIVPEARDAIDGAALGYPNFGATLAGNHLVVNYLKDVRTRLAVFRLDGTPEADVPLPGPGAVSIFSGALSARADTEELFFGFASFLTPTTVYRYTFNGRPVPFVTVTTPFNAVPFETTQVFYPSKDGTRIPMFITARKGLVRDGSHPTLLTGYGGFSITIAPAFAPEYAAWLDAGGILAVPNLRGGGEYGEKWHAAGQFERKQNVFDDFIGAAEYLIRERYTSAAHLAIQGASNGGLLVGAAMTQRPDLFAAAVPSVGVLDMLRYHRFTIARFWISEYGSSEDPAQFTYLRAYSPLHNVRSGVCYPATLVTTADHDDRVVPGHSFKFAATLQAVQPCAHPVLIRVETTASHGYNPTDKRIAELADIFGFMASWTGLAASGGAAPPR
jgi:prolyl oligopeptidase